MNNIFQSEGSLDKAVREWQNPNYVKNLAFLDIVQVTSMDVVNSKKAGKRK